jgi:hypothetical protein
VKRSFLFSFLILVERTPWTEDQPVARPLPNTNRINANRHHALSGIRTHDPSVQALDRAAAVISSLEQHEPYLSRLSPYMSHDNFKRIQEQNLWSSGQSSWLQIQRTRVPFPALPDFLRSGSGTESTQPRVDN